MAARTRRTAAAKTEAPEPEIVDTDDAVELEDLDESEVSEAPPAKGKKKAAGADITFGIQDLVALIKTETGKDTDPRSIRTLIRKMARDGSGRVTREITPGNRTRYNWTGPNDAEVRAIIEAFKGGELDRDKAEKLRELKERKAKKTAAAKAASAPAAVEEVEEDNDEDLDFDDE